MSKYQVTYTVEFQDGSRKTATAEFSGDNCIEVEQLLLQHFLFHSTLRLTDYSIKRK